MPYIVLDLEMTGLEAGYHDIIQIGAVLTDDQWNQLSTFQTLVYPDNIETMTSTAEAIHGISLHDLEEAPDSYEALEKFEKWVRNTLRLRPYDQLKNVLFCGQSVINDINFLRQKYSYLNINWPFDNRMIDLMTISFFMYKVWDENKIMHPRSYSLKAVAEHFGLKREGDYHNALDDAKLTYECFKRYFEWTRQLKFIPRDIV